LLLKDALAESLSAPRREDAARAQEIALAALVNALLELSETPSAKRFRDWETRRQDYLALSIDKIYSHTIFS
jgi:hypothetical protein